MSLRNTLFLRTVLFYTNLYIVDAIDCDDMWTLLARRNSLSGAGLYCDSDVGSSCDEDSCDEGAVWFVAADEGCDLDENCDTTYPGDSCDCPECDYWSPPITSDTCDSSCRSTELGTDGGFYSDGLCVCQSATYYDSILCMGNTVNCVGAWGAWEDCSQTCGSGTKKRTFSVTESASARGDACSSNDGDVEIAYCNTLSCSFIFSSENSSSTSNLSDTYAAMVTNNSESVVVTLSVLLPITILGIIIGVSIFFLRKKQKYVRSSSPTKYVTAATHISDKTILNPDNEIRHVLDRGDFSWHRMEIIFKFLKDLNTDKRALYGDPNEVQNLESRALDVVRAQYAENSSLQNQAIDRKEFSQVATYSARLEQLSFFTNADDAAIAESGLECVAHGLLLHKNRFAEESDAILGHGASASVSKGYWIRGSGDAEIRTEVAVKEVSMAGKGHSNYAIHEFAILTKKLQPLHPNVIRVYDIKSSASANFVIMELCCFSLDDMPQTFKDFLYSDKDAISGTDLNIRQLVMNGLVQDILQGTAFLHSKEVAHCDLKPGNVLCSFDRCGKKRAFKPKYFQEAQLKLTDFGVSRVIQRSKSAGDYTTATVSLDTVKRATGIAGSEGYMSPEVLRLVKAIKSGSSTIDAQLNAEMLIGTDSFAAGCVIAFLCSNGKHPFEHGLQTITQNILTGRRRQLKYMGIINTKYISLIMNLTAHEAETRWNPQKCLDRSTLFASNSRDQAATILMDSITLRKRPQGSCREQLAKMPLFKEHAEGQMQKLLTRVDNKVTELSAQASTLPVKLDKDSLFAIAAYTLDTGQDRSTNLYFVLNNVLRSRKTEPISFRAWQGFLFFLMRGLDLLKPEEGVTVYRGGNNGLDQKTVARDYTIGRPIQWAAFSSTTTSPSAARLFVRKNEGRNIGPYSFFPKESEVLLSPNARFTVTRSLYKDEAGYSWVDLMETQGGVLNS